MSGYEVWMFVVVSILWNAVPCLVLVECLANVDLWITGLVSDMLGQIW